MGFKKQLCKSSFLLLLCVVLFSGCQPENFQPSNQEETHPVSETYNREASELDHYYLKKKFALALHQAMIQSVELRGFLKNEALQKFDEDYDILYNYVKNKHVGDSTFRELLLPFFENEGELSEIENTLEALTIFIPSLPQNSFSAETWNTSQDVPLVAIRLLNNDKTPIIDSQGQSYLLDDDVIPGFPVVVIKECERITVPSFPGYTANDSQEYVSESGFGFKFSDPAFNGIDPIIIEITDGTPQYLVDAWEVNGENQNIGWQRDYLYYTISQANSSGPYINSYSENLKNFRLEGTPINALNSIAQPPLVNSNLADPELIPAGISTGGVSQGSFWTDGAFEFNVYLKFDVDKDPLEKGFTANAEDLFDVEYIAIDLGWGYTFFYITDLEKKTLPLNLELLPWRLHDYSNQWKLTFEEQDLPVKVTDTYSYSSTYNANFTFNLGDVIKVGPEFGGSAEQTHTSTVQLEYTRHSNDLKSTIVHFGDNVIIDEGNVQFPLPFFNIKINYTWYKLRSYTTGECTFSLVPVKVQ